MRCESCGKNEAVIQVVQVVNGVKASRHLCGRCAPSIATMSFAHFFESPALPKSCPHCGTTFADFNKNGLFGCGECYNFFEKDLAEPLRNLHGSVLHVGNSPEPDATEVLRKKLQEAVASEDYEEAARLRDEIRDIQGGDTDE